MGFFSSLVYRDYRRLWGATACSQAALWALIVLRGALVYELTKSNAWVGFITMAAHLPSLIVTPFAGFLARVGDPRRRGQLLLWLGLLSGLTPIVLGFAVTLHQAMLAVATVGASTAAFMTLSYGIIQTLAPDGIRGRVMSANTWHVQGATSGFNAINGLLMDVPWMTAPLLLRGTGILFVVVMLSSLLIVHLRSIYARGLSTGALAR